MARAVLAGGMAKAGMGAILGSLVCKNLLLIFIKDKSERKEGTRGRK